MDFLKDFPSYDDAIISILQLLGLSGSIIVIVGFAFAVQSWIGPAKAAGRGVTTATRAVVAHPPANPIVAFVVSAMVLIAQALMLGLCFLGGNYVAMGFDTPRWERTLAIFQANGMHSFSVEVVSQIVRWDPMSAIYVTGAGLLLGRAYVKAFRDSNADLTGIGAAVALPATILLVMAGIGAVFGVVIYLFGLVFAILTGAAGQYSKDQFFNFLPLLVGGAICLIYFLACQAGTRASKVVAWAWKPSIA